MNGIWQNRARFTGISPVNLDHLQGARANEKRKIENQNKIILLKINNMVK
jgi:hypothetical protein